MFFTTRKQDKIVKITDISLSPFTLKVKFTEEMDEYLLESFTDFLQVNSLISKSSQNKTLKLWVNSVSYQEFSELYNIFWEQFVGGIPGGKAVEIIGGIGVQIASIFSKMKPPERSIIRDTMKTKTALKLLDLVS